ncbi:MAG TPA: DinB family protein [Actinomycetota bacterium]|nr:DinB family protein [Actinomycetota bacterium]
MFADASAFLGWFEGVHRRTLRDVVLLPEAAERWLPPAPDPESGVAWGVPDLVRHLCEGRLYFTGAFLNRGWIWDTWESELATRAEWSEALESSFAAVRDALEGLPPEAMTCRIELIAAPDRTISAWRALMMMAEHEIAHRAQIGAYAGLNGWPVAQIFDRTNEWVRSQRGDEAARRSDA